jgi:predicted PolB exonuclease-like 3'-5' exonuclease
MRFLQKSEKKGCRTEKVFNNKNEQNHYLYEKKFMINIDSDKILFLDIETVPIVYHYKDLPDKYKKLFEKKLAYRINENNTVEDVYEKAGIWAEFGKIVAISFGKFKRENGKRRFYIHNLASENEKELLEKTQVVLDKFYKSPDRYLCAHNGKEFDFPYIARRMIINRISLPKILRVHGFKPWETPYCDTMELWSFGDRKHYTSLELLCEILDIPTSKTDMDGSDVAKVFYEEKDLEKIKNYCSEDVKAVANVFLRFKEQDLLREDEIIVKDES